MLRRERDKQDGHCCLLGIGRLRKIFRRVMDGTGVWHRGRLQIEESVIFRGSTMVVASRVCSLDWRLDLESGCTMYWLCDM